MTEKAVQLIADFGAKGWNTDRPFERLFELAENPGDMFFFAKEYLNNFEKSATIFNDSLSYINEKEFSDIVQISFDILKTRKNENAVNAIEYASLQFPELLQPYTEQILEIELNEKTFYSGNIWRNLSREKLQIYKSKFSAPDTTSTLKEKLFECLMRSGDKETVAFAFEYAVTKHLFERYGKNYPLTYLELGGFKNTDSGIKSYCPNLCKHFSFPKNYLHTDKPIHIRPGQHPTWNLSPSLEKYKFGGILEEHENNPFFHLLTFHSIPKGLKISALPQLILGLHIREVNEVGPLFYKHDENGQPTRIGERKEIEIYSDEAIKETFISFADTPNRWEIQDWGMSNSRENLFRLGGEPTWIQSSEILTCPHCNEQMDFLMQLDSDLPCKDGGELMFGSGGICYVLWCDKSKVSGYIMQCT
jgi:hypothetical protein